MLWLILSLLVALLSATKLMFIKKALKHVDEYVATWVVRASSVPFALGILLFTGIPPLDKTFWISLAVIVGVLLIANHLYMKTLKTTPLSLTVPFLGFTPLFMLITSPIILGEFPKPAGIIGILLAVCGAYVLNIRDGRKNLLSPLKAIIKGKASRMMLIVALLYSIGANIDKLAVLHSSPLFYVSAVSIVYTVVYTPIMLKKSHYPFRQIKRNYKKLIPIGLFLILAACAQMFAIQMTLTSYVVAIKGLNGVFSVLYGYFIFKEGSLKQRLSAAALMGCGVAVMAVF